MKRFSFVCALVIVLWSEASLAGCADRMRQMAEDNRSFALNILRLHDEDNRSDVLRRLQEAHSQLLKAGPDEWTLLVGILELDRILSQTEVQLLAVDLVARHRDFLAEQLQDEKLVNGFLQALRESLLSNEIQATKNLKALEKQMATLVDARENELWTQKQTQVFQDPRYNQLREAINVARLLIFWNRPDEYEALHVTTTPFEELNRLLANAATTAQHGTRCTRADCHDCSKMQRSFRCDSPFSPFLAKGEIRHRPEALCHLRDTRFHAALLAQKNQVLTELQLWIVALQNQMPPTE